MVSVGSKGWKVSSALSRVATVRAKRAGTVAAACLWPRFMASGHVACISRSGARRCAKRHGHRRGSLAAPRHRAMEGNNAADIAAGGPSSPPQAACKISWETTPKRWRGFRQFLPGVRRGFLGNGNKKRRSLATAPMACTCRERGTAGRAACYFTSNSWVVPTGWPSRVTSARYLPAGHALALLNSRLVVSVPLVLSVALCSPATWPSW